MEQKTLTATERKELRKSANGRLRRSGKIPAVVYGHMKPTPIAIDEREFKTKFHTIPENAIINLDIDGTPQEVLVKDYQGDLLTGRIKHIDFYAIEKGKLLKTRVPIHLTGSSKGVKEGGILEMQIHEVDVECLPMDMPGELIVDISSLDTGHAVHIKDMAIPEGVRILNNGDQVVVSITHAKVEAAAPAAAAAEEAAAAEGEAAPAAPTA